MVHSCTYLDIWQKPPLLCLQESSLPQGVLCSVAYLSSSITSATRGVLITRQPLKFNTNEFNTWLGGSLQQEDACQRLFSMPWLPRELLNTHQTLCAVASLPGEPGTSSLRFCPYDRRPRYNLERESSSVLHILSKDKALTLAECKTMLIMPKSLGGKACSRGVGVRRDFCT